jgi:phosphoglycerol transferase MdoB-like AlkP superfamily enzyme
MALKIATFPRLVKWMFATGITFLVCMVLMRFVFFSHFRPSQYTFSNSVNALILGFRYDLRVVCIIILIPFLAGNFYLTYNKKRLSGGSIFRIVVVLILMAAIILLLKNSHIGLGSIIIALLLFALFFLWAFSVKNCNPFLSRTSKRVFQVYFFICAFLLALLYAVDFEHYDYLHQRLNASILNYGEDAKISMNMVWQTYPVFTLVLSIIISSVLVSWLINLWFKLFSNTSFSGHGITKIILRFVFILLLAIGIFGRLNQYPLRWSDAFAFDDDFKANLSLNPVQSFFSTLQFRHSTYDIKQVSEYYPLMTRYLGIEKPDSTTFNYKRTFKAQPSVNTPNIVVVICESFSAYKSSMWGNPLNTTPYFNEMCKQGIFFDRCFTPAYGTARGVWAVITGIPDVEYPNTASRNPAAVDQHTIINDYNGYDKFYFLGGSSSWANIRGLLTYNITDLHLYEEDSYKAKTIDVWGISDKRLFLAANDALKKQTRPFFAVIQTADNHRPYTIPDEDRGVFKLEKYSKDSLNKFGFQSNEELNAFRYTDFSFKTFIEAAKKEKYFNNTIFVFVGDHGIRGDAGNMFPKAWEVDGLTTQHVPLLFYSPALLTPQRIHRTCSQIDLLPSVTALANVSYTNTTLGKNLFDSAYISDTVSNNTRHFKNAAFLFDPGIKQIGMVTDEYCYVHNLLSGTEDFRSSSNDSVLAQTPAIKQDEKLMRELAKAYYETARYIMFNNSKRNSSK